MSRQTTTLRIRVKGPVLTAGLEAAAFGIDDSHLVAKGGETDGRHVLPESLVRGNVVHILREIQAALRQSNPTLAVEVERVQGWLGTKSGDVNGDGPIGRLDPFRRAVRFDDLVLEPGTTGRSITRIKLDAETGAVEHGSLQIVASPLDFGEVGAFVGTVTFGLEPGDAETARIWIERALAFMPALGALKGAGFGRIAGFELRPCQPDKRDDSKPALDSGDTRAAGMGSRHCARFALTFDRPFLVNSEAIGGNLFKGTIDVPGAAIKGALADEMKRRRLLPRLDSALDSVVVRHAKPAKGDTTNRPRAIPLSLYAVDAMNLRDALVDEPEAAGARGDYVEFQPDWKPTLPARAVARHRYGQVFEPAYDIRTRTAIGTDGTAQDKMLFTRMAVIPDGYVWIGEIEQAGVSDADYDEILGVLADGLHGLGKTRANATVAWLEPAPRTVALMPGGGAKEVWRLVLETDALLHGPGDQKKPLHDHYRAYFSQAIRARGGPEVVLAADDLRFYAVQRWIGGYQARRFPWFKDRYYPQLLTVAGSVFELRIPAGCAAAMASIARSGLPLPASIAPGESLQFERSAFNPENGYGEVSIESRDLTASVSGT